VPAGGQPEPGAGPAGLDGVIERAAAAAQVLVADPGAPVVDDTDAHHLSRVLRLRPGEVVVATDGRGHWSSCRYCGPGDRGGAAPADQVLDLDGPVRFEPVPAPPLTVAFAPVKGDRPEWVVQKLTELGIDRIVLLVTARSVVRWDGDRADKAAGRLRRVAAEAAGQSRRVWLPDVIGPCDLSALAALLSPTPGEPTVGGPAPGGQAPGGWALAQLGGGPPAATTTAVAVGPEGGWSPDELAAAPATMGLGSLVLRAETAAVAAGAILSGLRAGTVVGEGRP